MTTDLSRRLTAEALGTAMLVCTVVGSGIMADRLTQDVALALLGNTLPTGAILGLDAIRAMAEGQITEVTLETRKPPRGLAGAPHLLDLRFGLTHDHTSIHRPCTGCDGVG